LLDYGNWGALQPKGKATAHPKMGALKRTVWQQRAEKVRQCCGKNCHALRPRLEKVVAVGGVNSDYFSSYCPRLSIKTIFWI
jgi:hypothetical protein